MVARIREGTLLLNSREEYESLLELYPQKVSLHRALADFLSKQGDQPDAIETYKIVHRVYDTAIFTLRQAEAYRPS